MKTRQELTEKELFEGPLRGLDPAHGPLIQYFRFHYRHYLEVVVLIPRALPRLLVVHLPQHLVFRPKARNVLLSFL